MHAAHSNYVEGTCSECGNKCTDDYISIPINVDNEVDTNNDGHTSVKDVETSADGAEGIDGDISSEASVASTKRFLQTNTVEAKMKAKKDCADDVLLKKAICCLEKVGEKKRMTMMNCLGYMLHLS